MFKRVEKRRRKEEDEDALGLNEEMKEIMGLQDTDSEESDSGSEGSGDNEDEIREEDEEDEVNSEDEELPPITIAEALVEPVFIAALEPTQYACVVCPGRVLKGSEMRQAHISSNAHQRRLKQFKVYSEGVNSQHNAHALVAKKQLERSSTAEQPEQPKSTSKRAMKRDARKTRFLKQRQKQKVAAAAKRKETTGVQVASDVTTPKIQDKLIPTEVRSIRPKKKARTKEDSTK